MSPLVDDPPELVPDPAELRVPDPMVGDVVPEPADVPSVVLVVESASSGVEAELVSLVVSDGELITVVSVVPVGAVRKVPTSEPLVLSALSEVVSGEATVMLGTSTGGGGGGATSSVGAVTVASLTGAVLTTVDDELAATGAAPEGGASVGVAVVTAGADEPVAELVEVGAVAAGAVVELVDEGVVEEAVVVAESLVEPAAGAVLDASAVVVVAAVSEVEAAPELGAGSVVGVVSEVAAVSEVAVVPEGAVVSDGCVSTAAA